MSIIHCALVVGLQLLVSLFIHTQHDALSAACAMKVLHLSAVGLNRLAPPQYRSETPQEVRGPQHYGVPPG